MLRELDELELLPVRLETAAVPLIREDCQSPRTTRVPLKQLVTEHQHQRYAAACRNHPVLVPEECGLFTPTANLDEAWRIADRIHNGMAYYRIGAVWLADEPPF
ncbi:hypothetical protein GCM10022226_61740 [Sphaerisporangium flaviroseum]|uniref:Uncharacterized protein n=1 Tax=Sphaerisporangium flaviroseum TaxID=509199 RepID=A0ABP7J181_9ACTN